MMDEVWREAPFPALRIVRGPRGVAVEANPPARAWAAAQGLGEAAWTDAAEQACGDPAPEPALRLGGVVLGCRRVDLPDGCLLWLAPAPPAVPLPPPAERERRALAQALALSGVTVWRIDPLAQRVHFNTLGTEVLHMTPDPGGVPLALIRDTIHPDDREAVVAAAAEALGSDRVIDVFARYRGRAGGWRRLLTRRVAERDAAGRAIGLLGVALDVTEREAERARSELLAEQSAIVAQALGAGFWRLEGGSGVASWDAAMYRLYGRDPARPAPSADEWVDGYIVDEEREDVRRRLQADIAAWAPATLMTFRVRGDDGRERWVRAWTRRLERDGQRLAMGMHVDVTEQREHAELQREAGRIARESHEKSAFMAQISHRLRTPLNAVLGFAQLMAQDAQEPLGVRQRERLARIDAAGNELLALVDDVLEVVDLDAAAVARVAVPLAGLLAQLREAVAPIARQRGVALAVAEVDPALAVATDRRLLGQALRHLALQAVRRNPGGGWVALAVRVEAQAVALELRDGGPALTPRQRELLFDGSAVEPAGADAAPPVGLTLVREALERVGARLDWLHPDASDGALVLELPRAVAPDASAPGFALLCVEDNPVNLMLVQELVAMRPAIRFFAAEDGASGLALARRERPDVVLLDLHLPDIGGHEVLARLRAEPALAGCRVIALSANAVPEDIRAARALGFDDYWTKPIDFDQFLAGLDRLAAQPG